MHSPTAVKAALLSAYAAQVPTNSALNITCQSKPPSMKTRVLTGLCMMWQIRAMER